MFRKHPKLQLKGVPTLLQWGTVSGGCCIVYSMCMDTVNSRHIRTNNFKLFVERLSSSWIFKKCIHVGR